MHRRPTHLCGSAIGFAPALLWAGCRNPASSKRSSRPRPAAWKLVFAVCGLLAQLAAAEPPQIPAGFRPFTPRTPISTSATLSIQELLGQLRLSTWVFAVPGSTDPQEIRPPWHHPAITELVRRCASDRELRDEIIPSLRSLLHPPNGDPDRHSVSDQQFNAAVALAWLGDTTGFHALDRVFLDTDARLEKRTAAIFALATQPTTLDVRGLRILLDAWLPSSVGASVVGQPLPHDADRPNERGRARLRQPEELVAGVLWAVVRAEQSRPGYRAADDKLLSRAAGVGGVLVRRVVAAAFVGQTWEAPPAVLAGLLRDPAPHVRRTALAAIAVRPHAAVGPPILAATRDTDHEVRLAAIAQLPLAGRDAAGARLQEVLAGTSATERAAAVTAAAQLRLWSLVERGVGDESHVVRAAAAAALGKMPGEIAFETLRKLLADRSTQVQCAAVDALAARSALEAGPGLLDALQSPALQTRQRAWEALIALWAPAAAFPIHAPTDERSERLNDLRRQWRSQAEDGRLGQLQRADGAAPRAGHSNSPEVDKLAQGSDGASQVARLIAEWYRTDTAHRDVLAAQLVSLGPEVVAAIEEFLERHDSYPDAELQQRVLAELEPVYRALSLLTVPEVDESTALHALVRELQQRRLTAMQAIVIAEKLRAGVDSATWLALVDRLERDAPAEAAALDAVALTRPEAAIRLDACRRIGRRIESRHAGLLAPLFTDSNLAVRRAALRTAGRTHDPTLIAALRHAMHTPEARTRLAAAASLCDLGDKEAADEVERLAAHADPQIRRAAIDEVVNGPLLERAQAVRLFRRALDDPRIEVQRLAIAGLEQRAGTQPARPAAGQAQTLPERIAAWQRLLDNHSPTLLAN